MKSIIYDHLSHDVFSVPYYLIIEGGQGHGKKHQSGTYKFVGSYLNPSQTEGKGQICLSSWCEDNKFKYVHAETMEELITKLTEFKLPNK